MTYYKKKPSIKYIHFLSNLFFYGGAFAYFSIFMFIFLQDLDGFIMSCTLFIFLFFLSIEYDKSVKDIIEEERDEYWRQNKECIYAERAKVFDGW